ncbi:MAG TPA: amidohydrolase family protein, partial [Verrucomicrobiae bacterium]|nr:amidohydrolase family protein [Verrucomicrobiae bacterium]
DVMADVYPYTASSTTIRTLLPDWVLEGGIGAMLGRLRDPATRGRIRADMATGPVLARGLEWSDIMIASAPSHPEIEGLRLDEIARSWGKDPVEVAFDVIESEKGRGNIILFQLDEADLRRALVHPRVMIGSDGSSLATSGPMADGKPHPRSYGTFPRVLGRYARDERVLPLETAVHKMTGLPAARLGLGDRGVIRPGAKADIVAFSREGVRDLATYEDPHRYAAGISHVLVNGRTVIKDGEHTGSLPGRVLRSV